MSQVVVCRNKQSGKLFILLRYSGGGEAGFIIPNGKIKNLNLQLFDDIKEIDNNQLSIMQSKGLATMEQINKLEQYQKNREEEKIENIQDFLNQMSDWEKKLFIEEMKVEIEKDN